MSAVPLGDLSVKVRASVKDKLVRSLVRTPNASEEEIIEHGAEVARKLVSNKFVTALVTRGSEKEIIEAA